MDDQAVESTLTELAEEFWELVCKNILQVLEECKMHGLVGILDISDPSLEGRIEKLRKLDFICDIVIEQLDGGKNYSTVRIMQNAQQQILNLERLLNAALNGDREVFDEVVGMLKNQSLH